MGVTTLKNATYTHEIYDVTFYDEHITTTVTRFATAVDRWIANTLCIHRRNLHNLLVGLDTEWCVRFVKNKPQPQPVAILQLCVGHRCLIFQIRCADLIPKSLVNFLQNLNFTFAGVGIEKDVNKLMEDFKLVVSRTMDLPTVAAYKFYDEDMKQWGLQVMASQLLQKGVKKSRKIVLSRWYNKYLNAAQIEYACIDAFVSFELAMFLQCKRRE